MGKPSKAFYTAGLIEHESCISLRHPKCWNPRSELKTSRELGVGFGQLTKAFRQDGTIRFDKLTELRQQYPRELGELSWSTIRDRPDLQLRAMLIMTKEDYRFFAQHIRDPVQIFPFVDAAYNGGRKGVLLEIQACRLAGITKCNPELWFDNVERFCMKSKAPLYGNRSACDINRHHVRDVILVKAPKYRQFFLNGIK